MLRILLISFAILLFATPAFSDELSDAQALLAKLQAIETQIENQHVPPAIKNSELIVVRNAIATTTARIVDLTASSEQP